MVSVDNVREPIALELLSGNNEIHFLHATCLLNTCLMPGKTLWAKDTALRERNDPIGPVLMDLQPRDREKNKSCECLNKCKNIIVISAVKEKCILLWNHVREELDVVNEIMKASWKTWCQFMMGELVLQSEHTVKRPYDGRKYNTYEKKCQWLKELRCINKSQYLLRTYYVSFKHFTLISITILSEWY